MGRAYVPPPHTHTSYELTRPVFPLDAPFEAHPLLPLAPPAICLSECHFMLWTKCALSKLGESSDMAANHSSVASAFRAARNLDNVIAYNTSLDYWLEVLEALSRARARVLIVTSFAASVKRQIPKLALIHPRHNLSGLSFRVLAAPLHFPLHGTPDWPLPDHKKDFTYATSLDRLLASREWDANLNQVAFLGCSIMGLPVARFARAKGVSSVYVGGLIQLFFGIAGMRYLECAAASASHSSHTHLLPLKCKAMPA